MRMVGVGLCYHDLVVALDWVILEESDGINHVPIDSCRHYGVSEYRSQAPLGSLWFSPPSILTNAMIRVGWPSERRRMILDLVNAIQ